MATFDRHNQTVRPEIPVRNSMPNERAVTLDMFSSAMEQRRRNLDTQAELLTESRVHRNTRPMRRD